MKIYKFNGKGMNWDIIESQVVGKYPNYKISVKESKEEMTTRDIVLYERIKNI